MTGGMIAPTAQMMSLALDPARVQKKTISDDRQHYSYGTEHSPEMIRDLSQRAQQFRTQVLRMIYQRGTGHIGGAFSIAEVVTALYFHHLKPAFPF